MKKNMGNTDKYIRLFLVLVFAALVYFKVIEGYFGIAALSLAVVFILTSLMSFCPLYTLFGINTCKRE